MSEQACSTCPSPCRACGNHPGCPRAVVSEAGHHLHCRNDHPRSRHRHEGRKWRAGRQGRFAQSLNAEDDWISIKPREADREPVQPSRTSLKIRQIDLRLTNLTFIKLLRLSAMAAATVVCGVPIRCHAKYVFRRSVQFALLILRSSTTKLFSTLNRPVINSRCRHQPETAQARTSNSPSSWGRQYTTNIHRETAPRGSAPIRNLTELDAC